MEFVNLRKRVVKEYEDSLERMSERLLCPSQEELSSLVKSYLTPLRIRQFEDGKLSRKKAIELITNAYYKESCNVKKKYLAKIEAAENAPDIDFISISVEWFKSRTWGNNPEANVITGYAKYQSERISGCGYDKESTATAKAMNQSPEILKLLYIYAENEKEFPYGTGYDILPTFAHAVGFNCHRNILEACGMKYLHGSHGKVYDTYEFERAK